MTIVSQAPSTYSNAGAATRMNLPLTKPTGTAVDDFLLAFGGNASPEAMTLAGWTELGDVMSGGDVQGACWWKFAAAADPASWTTSSWTTNTGVAGVVLRYTGVQGIRVASQLPTTDSASRTGATTAPLHTALTGVQPTDLVVHGFLVANDVSGTTNGTLAYPATPTGWTNKAKLDLTRPTSSNWAAGLVVMEKLGSTELPRPTSSQAAQWVQFSVALIDAAATPRGAFLPFCV